MKLVELRTYLDRLLPGNGSSDFAPNGLQVEGKEQVKRVATAVSASTTTIEAAIEQEADVLIVHHGLFWNRDSYVIEGVKRKKIELLLKHGLSLFAYHLPLDMHQELGNNWVAAKEMGWSDLTPFGFIDKVQIGVKGSLPPCSREVFKEKLERYYGHEATCAFGGAKTIRKAALISGGAYKYLADAAKEGVDAFITGNFDEPAWHQAMEEGINFFALGHSATERIGPLALARHLERSLELTCAFIDIENPF